MFFEEPKPLLHKTVYTENKLKTITCQAVVENLECDIAIIGGGLAGLSLAYHLAKHGKNFVLIDSQKIGDAASGINGGFCSPGWSVDFDTLSQEYGLETAKDFYNISLEGLRWVHSFKDNDTFKLVDFNTGIVNLSLLKSEECAREFFLKNNLIVRKESQFISKKSLKSYVNSPFYQSGILVKSGFSFNPLNFLIGLKNEIQLKRSGVIFENSKMISFVENNKACQITLANGSLIQAQRLVIATGGYGGDEIGYLRSRWLPITTSIAVTKSLPEEVKEIINPNFAFSDDRRAGNYFRLISDNRLLWGRGINAIKPPNPKELKKLAQTDIKKFFPSLQDINSYGTIPFDYVWSGKMAYSKSMMPYVGRFSPRTYMLTGFGGHGMNTAPAAAILLAECLLGLSDRVSIFKKVPLKWNGYKFGPIAAELLYRLMTVKDFINQNMLSIKEK